MGGENEVKQYKVDFKKLIKYLEEDNVFRYKYIYEKHDKNLNVTEVELMIKDEYISMVKVKAEVELMIKDGYISMARAKGYTEIESFRYREVEEFERLEKTVHKHLINGWDFEFNEGGVVEEIK